MARTYASGAKRAAGMEQRERWWRFERFLLGHSATLRAFVLRHSKVFVRTHGVDVHTALRVYDTTVGALCRSDVNVDMWHLAHVADDAEWIVEIMRDAEKRLAGLARTRLRRQIDSWCEVVVICRRNAAMARLGAA